jgi:hypothetical protein
MLKDGEQEDTTLQILQQLYERCVVSPPHVRKVVSQPIFVTMCQVKENTWMVAFFKMND